MRCAHLIIVAASGEGIKAGSPLGGLVQPGHRPAIFIVDDEPEILMIMLRLVRNVIGSQDIDIQFYVEPAAALADAAFHDVRLAIVDYKMLGMDGMKLIAKLRQMNSTIEVVLMTAYATPEIEGRALAQGIQHYLPKPFRLDHLERIIDMVFP